MTGLTAYAGLTRIARLHEGDVVFISGAAGAVGGAAGQIAKQLGASRVIGSAGSPEKVRHLIDDLGYDAAFYYRDRPLAEALRRSRPRASTCISTTSAATPSRPPWVAEPGGRIAVCGRSRSTTTTEPAPGPRNLARLSRAGRIEGSSSEITMTLPGVRRQGRRLAG